ncbi:IS1182 family transposase [Chlamydiota bacterium]
MAYRYGNREQMQLLPSSIEEYIDKDDPVRAYNAFVDALDVAELGIDIDENKVGNSSYDPSAMLKLLVYGYSYGWRSARKLERALHHNVSFMWIVGGLKPDYKTIAEFRRKNKKVLRKVLKGCARLCIELDLIEGNTLFVDGTKIRANASIKNTWTKQRCKKTLAKIDRRIDDILTECERVDRREENQASLVHMKEELTNSKVLKTKVNEILKDINNGDKKSVNTTDSECGRMNSVQGSHAGYNVQNVVDRKHGLIVTSDVTNENNDRKQFANQINRANEVVAKKCKVACADQGYGSTDELEKIDKEEITVIVPPAKEREGKDQFTYNSKGDYYSCSEGNILTYRTLSSDKRSKIYRMKGSSVCRTCKKFGKCTKAENGRTISRLIKEDLKKRFERIYQSPESQEIYKLRKQKVELPFGHIKRNLGVSAFHMKGLDGAKAEMSLLSSCFNISRLLTMFGVQGFIKKIVC